MVDMQPVASQSQVQEEGRKKQRLELKADFPAPTLVTVGSIFGVGRVGKGILHIPGGME